MLAFIVDFWAILDFSTAFLGLESILGFFDQFYGLGRVFYYSYSSSEIVAIS
jgi:hypothetical protein